MSISEPQPFRRDFKQVVEAAVAAVDRKFDAVPNARQLVAIEAQVRAYWFDDVPADGLAGYTVESLEAWLGEFDAVPNERHPEGTVVVQFRYIQEGEAGLPDATPGLEVTVFGPDGKVIDSQDFG